jgi:hypothetical protein
MIYLSPFDRLLLQRGAEHLHRLGPRASAEYLAEVSEYGGCLPWTIARLAEYRRRLTPEMIRVAGADRFPLLPSRTVPR